MHWIGAIHKINAVRGANGSPWWWCLWGGLCWCSMEFLHYSYCTKPTKQEFIVSAQTPIVVKLLKVKSNLSLDRRIFVHYFQNWKLTQKILVWVWFCGCGCGCGCDCVGVGVLVWVCMISMIQNSVLLQNISVSLKVKSNLSHDRRILVSFLTCCALSSWIANSFHLWRAWLTISTVDLYCMVSVLFAIKRAIKN